MEICCLIDSLNSGGAQRQMTWLIRSLVELGHDVRLLTYYEYDHYLPLVRSLGVKPENVESSTKIGRFWNVRAAIRKHKPDVIISFLKMPNMMGVFAGLPPKRIPTIVSERSQDVGGKNLSNRIRFNVFRQASKVVANSHTQNEFIKNHFPFLSGNLSTIVNCVDLEKFKPNARQEDERLRIMIAATVCDGKNPFGLIRASSILFEQNVPHSIDWFGKSDTQPKCLLQCQEMISELGLEDTFRFRGPVTDMHARLSLIHI